MACGLLPGAVGTGRDQRAAGELSESGRLAVRCDTHGHGRMAAAYDGRKRGPGLHKPGVRTRPGRKDLSRQCRNVGLQGPHPVGYEDKTLGGRTPFETQKTLYGAAVAGVAAQPEAGLDGIAHDPAAAHDGADVPKAPS